MTRNTEVSIYDPEAFGPVLTLRGSDPDVMTFEYDQTPFDVPVGSSPYMVRDTEAVSGTCPLCNNQDHAKIDADLVRCKNFNRIADDLGVHVSTVLFHVANHVMPIYGPMLSFLTEEVKQHDYKVPSVVTKMKKQLNKIGPEIQPWVEVGPSDDNEDFRDGTIYRYGKLLPWTKERTMKEIAMRQRESINFFSEMLEIKDRLRDIHDEIMTSDREDRITSYREDRIKSEGIKSTGYAQKNYAAAVQALKGEKDIITDLLKFSLIKASLEDATDNKPKYSAAVSSALRDIIGSPIKEIEKEMKGEAIRILQETETIEKEMALIDADGQEVDYEVMQEDGDIQRTE